MTARRRLLLLERRQRGFEDGLAAAETEPVDYDSTERTAYRAGREAGEQTRESIERGTISRVLREGARDRA